MTLLLQAAPAGSGSGPIPTGADAEMRDLLLGAIPALRAFAFSLTYDFDRSDDLVTCVIFRVNRLRKLEDVPLPRPAAEAPRHLLHDNKYVG